MEFQDIISNFVTFHKVPIKVLTMGLICYIMLWNKILGLTAFALNGFTPPNCKAAFFVQFTDLHKGEIL